MKGLLSKSQDSPDIDQRHRTAVQKILSGLWQLDVHAQKARQVTKPQCHAVGCVAPLVHVADSIDCRVGQP